MKILITGGAGYLGARLSEYLAKKGNEIFILDNINSEGRNDWRALISKIFVGDIRNNETLSQITGFDFDVIIHTISLDHNASANMEFEHVHSINVFPTWKLLENFSQRGLKKFIYFSTQQVYGRTKIKNISEEIKPNPANIYGLTHLMSEEICNYYNSNSPVKCINIRLSNSYGPPIFKDNNCWWLVINDFCRSAMVEKKIRVLSNGTPQRDFINIRDICRGIELLINTPSEKIVHNIFNIGSGQTLTIMELAIIVSKSYQNLYKRNLPIVFVDGSVINENITHNAVERFSYNLERIKELGFKSNVTIEEGVKEIFEYLEKNIN
jgi:UDP-glucose 4-epimerase